MDNLGLVTLKMLGEDTQMTSDPNSWWDGLHPWERVRLGDLIAVLEASWAFSCSSRPTLLGQAGPPFFRERGSSRSLDLESLISAGAPGIGLVEPSFPAFWTPAVSRSCECGLAEGFNLAGLENGLAVVDGGTPLPARTHLSCCLTAEGFCLAGRTGGLLRGRCRTWE